MRHKDLDWNLAPGTKQPGGSSTHEWPSIHAALLMDIRDEMKQLNRLLGCVRFTGIPTTLNTIARNTTKRRPPKSPPKRRAV